MKRGWVGPLIGTLAACVAPLQAFGEPVVAGGYLSPKAYPGMEPAWRDEFSGSELDVSSWSLLTGGAQDGGLDGADAALGA